MTLYVDAIYKDGNLKLLESVGLKDGQRVKVKIEENETEEAIRAALGDMIIWPDPNDDRHPETEAMADEIAQAFSGGKSLSEMIIEDRGEI